MSQEKRKWSTRQLPNNRKKSKLVKIKTPTFDKNRWKNKLPSMPLYVEEPKESKRECTVCDKKFQSDEALIQHLKDKKDEKHRLHSKKNESQSENFLNSKSQGQCRAGIATIGKMLILKNKPNLTENEKAEPKELTELVEEEHKRTTKRLNKKYGLPEDTPSEVAFRLYDEECKLHRKEVRKKIEEIRAKTRTMVKESNEREKEFKLKIEQMKKDTWEEVAKSAKKVKDKNPNIGLSSPIKRKKRKYKSLPPLKRKYLGERHPFKSKNELLHMSTG